MTDKSTKKNFQTDEFTIRIIIFKKVLSIQKNVLSLRQTKFKIKQMKQPCSKKN